MPSRRRLVITLSLISSLLSMWFLSWADAQEGGRPPVPPAPGSPSPDTKVQPFRTGLEGSDTRPTPPGARVSFNLEDADLPDLIRIISKITGKRFILPSKSRSIRATIYSPTDVTAAEAYQAFLSILQLNGLTLEPSGRYYKVIETNNLEQRPLPLYDENDPISPEDRYVTRLHRLEHVSVEEAANLLARFKSPEGGVATYAPTNLLIITDTAANIRRMLRILREIDVPRAAERVWVEPVHHAPVNEIIEIITQVFPPESGGSSGGAKGSPPPRPPQLSPGAETQTPQKSGGEARIRTIIGDERTNSLIIVATERAYLQLIGFLRLIDVPVEGEGGVHVHPLRYADAEEVAEVLSNVGDGGRKGGGGRPRPGGAEGAAISGQVRITAYKPTNSLIITASLQDYAALRRVISRIDVPPRQVFIEAVIMELQVERSTRLGIGYHGGLPEPNIDGNQGLTVFGFSAQQSLGFPLSTIANPDALAGLAVGVRGPSLQIPGIGVSVPSFGAVLTALATSSDVDVLSTPHLIAMDNAQAEINVGANVPLQTAGFPAFAPLAGLGGLGLGVGQPGTPQPGLGAVAGLAGLGGLAGGFFGFGVQRQTVGTTIRITPHINDTGDIRLEIEEEISEAGSPQGQLGVVPIEQRVAKTQVFARDQQTIVIGGLIRDRIQNRETKIPILGDIPVIGELFRTTSRETQKRNLVLFLTPYIIRSPEDLRAIFERRIRERQEFLDRYFVFGAHDYRPAIDHSRTRGIVLEIANKLKEIDEEREFLRQLQNQPPREHRARPPAQEAEPYQEIVIEPENSPQQSPPNSTTWESLIRTESSPQP
ncbi:MAG: type II secretion system secretin GspD [Sandaracinaceae bacterium]|nr:type II secretion system secretin GspD [Sandaracinaceae bacterium]